jgi:hypothetical protein
MTKEAAFTETHHTYSTPSANHARHDNLSHNHNVHLPSAGQTTRQAGDRYGKIRPQRTVHALDDQASEAAIRAHGRLISALVFERRLFITCCARLQPHHEVPPIPPTNAIPDMMMHDDLPSEQPYDHHSHPSHSFTGGKAPIPPPAPSSPPAPSPPPAPSAIPETEYIPEPPPQPFSSEDSADAVALRAAISSLQFQKQKARTDLQILEELKKKALEDPQRYKRELLAGTLKEQRPNFGSIRDVLDAPEEEGDEDDEVILGARDSPTSRVGRNHEQSSSEVSPTNQPAGKDAPFGKIPGPQTVVRMPPINWDKYHVVGESLDALHEQQRRWPGSTPGQDSKGREHSVAAPYSPFYDTLDSPAQQQQRNDSHGSALGTSFGSTSEHPMETRRTSRN